MTAAVTRMSVTLSRQSTADRRPAMRLVVNHVVQVPRPRRSPLAVPAALVGATPVGAHRRVGKRAVHAVLHLILAVLPPAHATLLLRRALRGPIHVVQLSVRVIREDPLNAIGMLPPARPEMQAIAGRQHVSTGMPPLASRVTQLRVVRGRPPVVQIVARP
jgi:hypothetical protein